MRNGKHCGISTGMYLKYFMFLSAILRVAWSVMLNLYRDVFSIRECRASKVLYLFLLKFFQEP